MKGERWQSGVAHPYGLSRRRPCEGGRGAAFRVSWPRFRRRSVTSRTKSCVHTRLPLRWHDLETFLLHRVEDVLGPGVASIQTPYLDTICRRRNPLEPIRGMQRPFRLRKAHGATGRMGVRPALSPFTCHLSLFTNHGAGRSLALPGLPYALAADNFCTSSLVSFTSAKRNKGASCSGVRALAMGATTVG